MYNVMYMIRKQIYLEERQQQTIRSLAALRGVSEAEVIRQAIEAERGPRPSRLHLDPNAWGRALKLMRSKQKRTKTKKDADRRQWSRAELYEDRLSRYDRRPR